MTNSSIVLVAAIALHPPLAWADGGPLGLGIVVGDPTGITGMYKVGSTTAIDAAIGLDDFGIDGVYVHADYLFILPNLLSGGSASLSPYLGPGAFLVLGRGDGDRGGSGSGSSGGGGKDSGAGLHVPFGLSLEFRRVPLQIFLELSTQLQIVPDLDFDLGGALGFRYYF